MSAKAEIYELLSNYVAVTPLEESDHWGILLPRDQGLLRTPAGHPVRSENYKLMLHTVRELEEHPVLKVADGIIVEPRSLSCYLLLSTQRDFLVPDMKIERDQIEHDLTHDPILHPSAGPEWTDQVRAWEPIGEFLELLGAELHPQGQYSEGAWNKLVDAIWTRWNKLSSAGKSVVINLQTLTEGHLIAAIALASRACNEIAYAHSVLAASPMHHTFGDLSQELSPEEQHTSFFRYCRDLARVCTDYLAFFPSDSIALLVEAGEGRKVEFKSTFRWDVRQEKNSDAITHASLKTISAFLNTDGGTLLIGVADDKTAVGIEADGFPNDDKFMLHFYGVIKASMGIEASTLVQADIDMFEGRKICIVRCKLSSRPVYIRVSGKEEFFIRTGPSSQRLGPSDLVSYISQHFKAS